jgi:hypothetical protein
LHSICVVQWLLHDRVATLSSALVFHRTMALLVVACLAYGLRSFALRYTLHAAIRRAFAAKVEEALFEQAALQALSCPATTRRSKGSDVLRLIGGPASRFRQQLAHVKAANFRVHNGERMLSIHKTDKLRVVARAAYVVLGALLMRGTHHPTSAAPRARALPVPTFPSPATTQPYLPYVVQLQAAACTHARGAHSCG